MSKELELLSNLLNHSQISISFTGSSGPGGQNVNRNATQAIVHCLLPEREILQLWLDESIITKLYKLSNKNKEIVVSSQLTRSQLTNKENALKKLNQLLLNCLHKPKTRKKTKPSKASIEKRLKQKKVLADKKRARRSDF